MAKKSEKPPVLTDIPEWASAAAIAKLIGKSVRRVQQLTQDGVLQTDIPPGGGARKYRTCETIGRYVAHVEEQSKDSGDAKTAELNLKKLQAEVDLKESQGQLHRLKTAIAEGKYIPAEQATQELAAFMQTFQQFAAKLPSRIAGTISSSVDDITVRAVKKSIEAEIAAMLDTFLEAATLEDQEGAM